MHTRRRALVVLLTAYMTARVLAALSMHSEAALYAALDRRADEHLPAVVCFPAQLPADDLSYYPTLYAVIPSIMARASDPCDMSLTP